MCKASLPVRGGQALSTDATFNVIAYNHDGQEEMIVSSGQTFSGALACARGFNSGNGRLVAVVLPAGLAVDFQAVVTR